MIGFDRLRREYREFKDKRQLVRDYDFFLADIRIYKMLPEVLGKEFYSKKAFPCPIKMAYFERLVSPVWNLFLPRASLSTTGAKCSEEPSNTPLLANVSPTLQFWLAK